MPLFSELSANLPDGHTILYIEDNLASIRLIEEILHERTDIEFLSAREGQIGLDLARQRSPDLVLLDLGLPDLPGLDVLSQLQSAEATRRIPCIGRPAHAVLNGRSDRLRHVPFGNLPNASESVCHRLRHYRYR